MVINIRGTNGSGKSTVVRQLMDLMPVKRDWALATTAGTVPLGHFLSQTAPETRQPDWAPRDDNIRYDPSDIYVVGRYDSVCGGCDRIKTQDAICDSVRLGASRGSVVFEGVLVSTIFARYAHLADNLTALGHRFVFAFMNTPLEICFERIEQRRAAAGRSDVKPFNREQVTSKYETCRRHAELLAATHEVVWLDHRSPMDQFRELFR